MSRNEIYDVSAELEKEFGAKGTPQREAAINHAWEEYNAQILLDARKNAGLTQAELAKRIGADKGYISRTKAIFPVWSEVLPYRQSQHCTR